MAKKANITKVSDKIKKVNDVFTVYFFDNGYGIEIGGKAETDDWKSVKLMYHSFDELVECIKDISSMERAK